MASSWMNMGGSLVRPDRGRCQPDSLCLKEFSYVEWRSGWHAHRTMLQFHLHPEDGLLLGDIDGLVSIEAWSRALGQMEEALKPAPADRLLLDLSGLLGWLGVPERQRVGAMMARHLSKMAKVALVIEAAKITGVVEAEAQRNGLALRLFSERDEAVEWVRS